MLFSYFIDGFAYAGEALTGKYIGANDRPSLVKAVRMLFVWSAIIGVISTVTYAVGGEWMVRLMTTEPDVIEGTRPYLFWLVLMPVVSCAAFMWDGIYIGATASVPIRNSMIWACAAFYIVYFIFRGSAENIQVLWYAYFAHLVARAIYLSLASKKHIFGKIGG